MRIKDHCDEERVKVELDCLCTKGSKEKISPSLPLDKKGINTNLRADK